MTTPSTRRTAVVAPGRRHSLHDSLARRQRCRGSFVLHHVLDGVERDWHLRAPDPSMSVLTMTGEVLRPSSRTDAGGTERQYQIQFNADRRCDWRNAHVRIVPCHRGVGPMAVAGKTTRSADTVAGLPRLVSMVDGAHRLAAVA